MSLDIWLEISATPFEANITHNLNRMAEAAGVYKVLWRPEENEIKCARVKATRVITGEEVESVGAPVLVAVCTKRLEELLKDELYRLACAGEI
jgi:precorrin-6x reductase